MRLIMEKDERIGKKEIDALKVALEKEEASKGATIRAAFAGGMSIKEIANEFDTISYHHAYNVANEEVRKNGLESAISREREGVTKKSLALAMLKDGKSISETSQTLGCLYNQVWAIANEAGLTKKQQQAKKKGVTA